MKVPFLDLKAQAREIREDVLTAVGKVIDRTAFAGGPFTEAFEEEFAAYCGTRYAIGCGSGTDALLLSFRAMGIGPGDEVITAANTFIATAESISLCGATPVLADIDEETYTIDPKAVENAITGKTKAIVPVHLYGQTADIDEIEAIGRRFGIPVVEDACQAHGADYKGRRAGTLGAAGCFSFYPGKNLGAYGEAGAITTNDEGLCEAVRGLRDHGQTEKYKHRVVGWNSRMDGIQGAVLSVKLQHLENWTERRREVAALYAEAFATSENVVLPRVRSDRRHVYHLYVVRLPGRDNVRVAAASEDIATGIHYPIPIHLQEAYASLGLGEGAFPVTERTAGEILSLPIYPEMSEEQVRYVASRIDAHARRARKAGS